MAQTVFAHTLCFICPCDLNTSRVSRENAEIDKQKCRFDKRLSSQAETSQVNAGEEKSVKTTQGDTLGKVEGFRVSSRCSNGAHVFGSVARGMVWASSIWPLFHQTSNNLLFQSKIYSSEHWNKQHKHEMTVKFIVAALLLTKIIKISQRIK